MNNKKAIAEKVALIFTVLIFISLISLPIQTVEAEESSTTYGNGWKEDHHVGGRVTHTDGIRTYLRWDGNYRPWNELNVSSGDYPYRVEEFDTYYNLTKQNDNLTLKKNFGNYTFGINKISFSFTATPQQLNARSTYHNVGGVDYWYFTIPESIAQTTKRFNWDNRLPYVFNESGNTTNQSNFEYHRVGGQLRFYYNQEARDFGATSSLITFKFNSWVVGSGGNSWSGNVTHDNTTEVQATGNVELRQEVDDYVSYWRFDEGSGTNANDENTTSDNDGTLNNMDANDWVSGYYGDYALDFDGTDDYIDCGNDVSLDITDKITIETWVNPTSITYADYGGNIISKRGATGGYFLRLNNGGAIQFQLIAGTISDETIVSDIILSVGQWYHIVAVYDGSDKYIYINTTPKLESTTGSIGSVTDVFNIGCRSGVHTRVFNGTIDEVKIYNRALSASEINQTRDNEHYTLGNLTSWHDAGSGNETYKLSANFTFPANTNASINLYNNDTGAFIENLASHITTTNWNSTITSPVQDSKVNITLYGNVSQTPEIHNITYHTQTAGVDYTPPTPTNLQNTTGNFWVNYTWSPNSGNVTNSYNVSNQTEWFNGTTVTYYNESVSASEWVNITVYAWNSSGSGTLSAGSVSDQVQVSAADTTFTVSLPVGYTKPVFEPPNSTATNYPPNGQTSSQEFFNVTNSGNVNLDVRMRLNTTVSTITLKADSDNNPSGAKEVNTTMVTIYSGLGQGNSVNLWLWSDFDHTTPQTANRTMYINVSQS